MEVGCQRGYFREAHVARDVTVKKPQISLDCNGSLDILAVEKQKLQSEHSALPLPKHCCGTNLLWVLNYVSKNDDLKYPGAPLVAPDAYRNIGNQTEPQSPVINRNPGIQLTHRSQHLDIPQYIAEYHRKYQNRDFDPYLRITPSAI